MKRPFFPKLSALPCLVVLAALAATCATAIADSSLAARAKQHGTLTVGVDFPLAPYIAGTKFRTPEGIAHELALDLARRLQVPLTTRRATPAQRGVLLGSGAVDVLLVALPDNDPLYRSAMVVPTGYAAGPMAIMRTDTTIKSWSQLKGRVVCVAEGSLHAGTAATEYGAIEQRYRAPADALLAMRIGECDAAVHDSRMLEELIKLPEWKKFSARLPTGRRQSLALVAPRGDIQTARFLKQVIEEWRSGRYFNQIQTKSVRNIAFEVYLDQNVPDCH